MHKGKRIYFSGLAALLLLTVSCLTALADDISYTYDDLGRLSTMAQTDGSTILTVGHTFEETGNIARIATTSNIADADHDQMPDGWEIAHGLNPTTPNDALLDSDGDSLSNLAEFQAGTDPTLVDTDGDGVSDGDEIATGTNPLDPASLPQSSQDADIPFMSDLAMAILILLLIGQRIRKMPVGHSRGLFPVLLLLALPITVSPTEACTCQTGVNGVNVIGFEMIATTCPPVPFSDSRQYIYLINPLQCIGNNITAYSSYGDTMASPASLINYYVSNNYRVIRNPAGTHLFIVQNGTYPFSGTILGVNMAGKPAGVYYSTPSESMNELCTAWPLSDQDGDHFPDCLDCAIKDATRNVECSKNFGPPICL
ncbi:MAG TPA: hypothetical protein DCS43_06740 [Verrucomicrobia bacterium]|nr:hypothetical protein [Verrucomicrobiota bacterium]